MDKKWNSTEICEWQILQIMRHVQRITETARNGLEYLQHCLIHSISIKVSFQFLTKKLISRWLIKIQQLNDLNLAVIHKYLNCKRVSHPLVSHDRLKGKLITFWIICQNQRSTHAHVRIWSKKLHSLSLCNSHPKYQ